MAIEQVFDFTKQSVSPLIEDGMRHFARIAILENLMRLMLHRARGKNPQDTFKAIEILPDEIARLTSLSLERVKAILYPSPNEAQRLSISEFNRIIKAQISMFEKKEEPNKEEFDYEGYFKNFRETRGWTAEYAAAYWGVSVLDDYVTQYEPALMPLLLKVEMPISNEAQSYKNALAQRWRDAEARATDAEAHT